MDLITSDQVRSVATDRRRLAPFLASGAVYFFAGITVPVLLLFSGGWWLPKTVDDGPHLSTGSAVAIDILLIALFGLQHSGMARPSFKVFIARWVPTALERTVYILMACLTVWVVIVAWQPVPQQLWGPDRVVKALLISGFWLGFALVYAATLLLDHFHLLGLKQAYRQYVTQVPDATVDRLQVHGPYRLVRHPLMTGLLLSFWCAGSYTVGHVLWAGGLTGYIVLGTIFEERDLIARFGDSYRAYVARVPAFFPLPFGKSARSRPHDVD